MRKIFVSACLIAAYLIAPAAGNTQSISLGDNIADLNLSNVVNYHSDILSTTTFKDKLVILDFWGFGCGSCIAAFPKIDSLQKKYADKLQFILVNKEGAVATREFLKALRKVTIPDVPFVTSDTLLNKLFVHRTVPMHVWLAGAKEVKAITTDSYANEKCLDTFFSTGKISAWKWKDAGDFDYDLPPIAEGNGRWLDSIEFYSYIAKMPPLQPIRHSDFNIVSNNAPMFLFTKAFEENGKYCFYPRNSVSLEIRNAEPFLPPLDRNEMDEWARKYRAYYYDIKVPDTIRFKPYKIMQDDLMRYFNVHAKVEKRRVECLVLIRTSKKEKFKAKPTIDSLERAKELDGLLTCFRDWTFFDMTRAIMETWNRRSLYPIIDATGYTGKVDITLPREAYSNRDLSELRKAFQMYDLDFVKRVYLTDVLVIKEK